MKKYKLFVRIDGNLVRNTLKSFDYEAESPREALDNYNEIGKEEYEWTVGELSGNGTQIVQLYGPYKYIKPEVPKGEWKEV